MNNEDLDILKQKLSKLSEYEQKQRNLYLRGLANDEIQGPQTEYSSINKPWLKYYTEEQLMTDIPENINVYDYMKSKNIDNPDRIAINYYGKLYSYNDMFSKVEEYALKFSKIGIKNGDIVSICMPSTPETIFSFYALNKMGVICDMIDPRSNSKQLQYYLEQNGSKYLILCENFYKNLAETPLLSKLNKNLIFPITPSAPYFMKMFVNAKTKIDNISVKKNENVMYWSDFENIKVDKSVNMKSSINKDDVALIIHSSGTTSVPKGIVLTNKNVNSIAVQYKLTSLKTDPGSKFLSVIPAFASFGMVASINLPFSLSMENIILPMVSPEIFIKYMNKYDINFTLTIPANFSALSKSKKCKDMPKLYGPGCGGYSLNSTQEQQINDFLKSKNSPSPMLMGWGMSELSSTACLETIECSKLLSSGIPLSKNTVSIFSPGTDEELGINEEGEICVTGPSVMKEYLNNPEKTSQVLKKHSDGKIWVHSGDIGYIDECGRLFPIDRLERMIIKGVDGFKIFPQKIEEVIATSKYVNNCVVVGYNDENVGIIPKAYIVLKDEYIYNEKEAIEDIKNMCLKSLSVRAIPDEFEFIEKLPYTSMGKIDFKLLEKKRNDNSKKMIKK